MIPTSISEFIDKIKKVFKTKPIWKVLNGKNIFFDGINIIKIIIENLKIQLLMDVFEGKHIYEHRHIGFFIRSCAVVMRWSRI